jgi:IclR family KDG regulon transcriptional repressor
MPADTDDRYIVGPVLKALTVLDAIAQKGHPASLTTIAKEVGLPKTSVFRYLRTLSAAGFLNYDATSDRYSVGIRFRALATADKSIQRLRDCALPALTAINREFNETTNLAVLADNQIVYIDILESTRALRMQARIGGRDPVHSTALGKAILSQLPPDARAKFLSDMLPQRTLRTTTELKQLERQLIDAARSGVAVEIGENEEGSMCIGAAILDETGYPVGAISVSAPERRVTSEVLPRLIASLQAATTEISQRLCSPQYALPAKTTPSP